MDNSQKSNKTKFYQIHPQTVKHLRLGHPWIIKDQFTEQFPEAPGLVATSSKDRKSSWIFLGDPKHKLIKARYWGDYSNAKFKMHNFWNEFESRFLEAINFRKELNLEDENTFQHCKKASFRNFSNDANSILFTKSKQK